MLVPRKWATELQCLPSSDPAAYSSQPDSAIPVRSALASFLRRDICSKLAIEQCDTMRYRSRRRFLFGWSGSLGFIPSLSQRRLLLNYFDTVHPWPQNLRNVHTVIVFVPTVLEDRGNNSRDRHRCAVDRKGIKRLLRGCSHSCSQSASAYKSVVKEPKLLTFSAARSEGTHTQ